MKILHFINSLSSGGAEVFVSDLLLAAKKHPEVKEVGLLIYAGILDDKGHSLLQELKINEIKIYNLNLRKNWKKVYIPFLIQRVFKKFKPDIVHSHLDQADFFLFCRNILFKQKKMIFARTLHNNDLIERIPTFIHERIFISFDLTFSCSTSVQSDFQLKEFRKKIIPVPNGVNLKRFSFSSPGGACFQEINNVLRLCVIGSFNKRLGKLQKGQDLLLKAILKVDFPYNIDFLGDGSERIKFEEWAKKKGIAKNCRFHGIVENVTNFLEKVDFVVFPSRFEGLPIAAIESVINGKPLITSDIKAFDVFYPSSKISFKTEDVNDLRNVIKIANSNKKSFRENGKINTEKYREEFDIEMTCKKYIKNYKKVYENLN